MSVLDRIVAVIFIGAFGLHGIVYPLFLLQGYREMFAALGGPLPGLTLLALNRAVVIGVSVVPAVLFGLGTSRQMTTAGRRRLVVAAALVSLLVCLFIFISLKLPLWELQRNLAE